jgi:hypothetical protein
LAHVLVNGRGYEKESLPFLIKFSK